MKYYKCPTCRNRVGVGVELKELPQCANHPKPREMRLDTDHVVVQTALINETVWHWLHSLSSNDTSAEVIRMVDVLRAFAVRVPCGRYSSYRIEETFKYTKVLYETVEAEWEILVSMASPTAEQKKMVRSLYNTMVALEPILPGSAGVTDQ